MATPRAVKRKVEEAEAEGETCTKIARTSKHTPDISSSNVVDGADPWARLAATGGTSSISGRGSLSGWTPCPLCGIYSKKKHALGRGIANHLKDVHTPWNPGKLAQKIHRRQYERQARERQQSRKRSCPVKDEGNATADDDCSAMMEVFKPLVSWNPTDEEEKAWNLKMMNILRKIEEEQSSTSKAIDGTTSRTKSVVAPDKKIQSEDKTGKLVVAYRDSLPPFLMAASKGNLVKLQELVVEAKEKDERERNENTTEMEKIQNDHHLRTLLNTRDRHKSTADHWAAGGGHLDCLRYLYNLRASLKDSNIHDHQDLESKNKSTTKTNSKVRRRDGKTCLHYAARNGHVHCIRYLLELQSSDRAEGKNLLGHVLHNVDERSGEGTTPLHLACYGGHPRAVKHLIEEFGADPHATNDWGCTCAHWAAMTISKSEADVKDLCSYLYKTCGISFVATQGQGHTALHKASHRQNAHVIRWMAGSSSEGGAGLDLDDKVQAGAPDHGGHKPSDIWKNMGGDSAFAIWMKSSMGW